MGVRFKQNRMKLFNCSKIVFMTLKAKTAKSTVIPLLTLYVQRVKPVCHYKYLGIVLDLELSDDKNIQRQLQYKHYAVNCEAAIFFFSMFELSEKCTFSFLLYVHVWITIMV